MAEAEHDDLADALAKMAEADFGSIAPQPPVAAPAPTRLAKPVLKPAPARPAITKPVVTFTTPPAGVVPPPAAGPARSARPAAPAPAASARPAAPVVVPPSARRVRPAAPTITPIDQPPVDGSLPTGLFGQTEGTLIDDDDAVIVPAPDPSVFEHRPKKISSSAREKIARQKSIDVRRTLIPILLTLGVLLIAATSLKFLGGSDSYLSDLPVWMLATLVVLGLFFLSLAAVNMISVKKALEQTSTL